MLRARRENLLNNNHAWNYLSIIKVIFTIELGGNLTVNLIIFSDFYKRLNPKRGISFNSPLYSRFLAQNNNHDNKLFMIRKKIEEVFEIIISYVNDNLLELEKMSTLILPFLLNHPYFFAISFNSNKIDNFIALQLVRKSKLFVINFTMCLMTIFLILRDLSLRTWRLNELVLFQGNLISFPTNKNAKKTKKIK